MKRARSPRWPARWPIGCACALLLCSCALLKKPDTVPAGVEAVSRTPVRAAGAAPVTALAIAAGRSSRTALTRRRTSGVNGARQRSTMETMRHLRLRDNEDEPRGERRLGPSGAIRLLARLARARSDLIRPTPSVPPPARAERKRQPGCWALSTARWSRASSRHAARGPRPGRRKGQFARSGLRSRDEIADAFQRRVRRNDQDVGDGRDVTDGLEVLRGVVTQVPVQGAVDRHDAGCRHQQRIAVRR